MPARFGARRSSIVEGLPPLPRFWAAQSATAGGVRNTKILCIGDSTTLGYGALSAGTDGAYAVSYPSVLATLLGGSRQSRFGDGFLGVAGIQTYDPRIVIGANWIASSNIPVTQGGKPFQLSTPNTNSITFTPDTSHDTLEHYWARSASTGVWSWSVDGGSATNDGGTGANAWTKSTLSASNGAHTWSIQRTTANANAIYNLGFYAYNSAVKEISVINAGISGSAIADHASVASVWAPLNAYKTFAPDLTILMAGINDWSTGVALNSFATNLQTVITGMLLSGDVLLVSGAPSDTSVATIAVQQSYIETMRTIARANRIRFLNLTEKWGSYAAANAAGKMRDTKHPNSTGYADIAALVRAAIA